MNKVFLTTSVAMALVSAAIGESWAMTCTYSQITVNNVTRYTLTVKGDAGGSSFTETSCRDEALAQTGKTWGQLKGALQSVTLDNITSIGSNAFTGASLTSITVPASVTSIGSYAFSNCQHLASVSLPGVTSIGSMAFSNTYGLTSADMPNVTDIGADAFNGANQLADVNMPNVETIGSYAFNSCQSLTNVDIPNVREIGYGAFAFTGALSYVGLPKTDENGCILDDDNQCMKDEDNNPILLNMNNNAFAYSVLKCSLANSEKCRYCTATNANSSTPVFKPNPNLKFDDFGYNYNGDPGTCVASGGCGSGYVERNGLCVPTSKGCGSGYVLQNNICNKLSTGCAGISGGVCTCESGYLSNSDGKCTSESNCKNGFHVANNACVANPTGCNTFANNKCSECVGGYLEQDGGCVTSCDSGYKDMGGFCNRVRWTPAEVAKVLRDDDTNVVTITFKHQ